MCIEIRLGVKHTGRKRKHECEHRDKEQDTQGRETQVLHSGIPQICQGRIQAILEHVQQLTLTRALISLNPYFPTYPKSKKENSHRKKHKQLNSFRVLGYLDSTQEPNSINRIYKYFQLEVGHREQKYSSALYNKSLLCQGLSFIQKPFLSEFFRARKIHSNQFK